MSNNNQSQGNNSNEDDRIQVTIVNNNTNTNTQRNSGCSGCSGCLGFALLLIFGPGLLPFLPLAVILGFVGGLIGMVYYGQFQLDDEKYNKCRVITIVTGVLMLAVVGFVWMAL